MAKLDLQHVLTVDDPDPPYIVENLLYEGQILMVAGDAGVGKSFLQYYMSFCVVLGLPFLGNATAPGPVLYFDEENGPLDLQQYLRWVWRGLGQPDLEPLKQSLHIEAGTLASTGNQRYSYMCSVAAAIKPRLIIIDTVTPACDIQDENNNSEAAAAMKELRKVRNAGGLATGMILLKHAKFTHEDEKVQTIRGAKHWLGAVDGTAFHKRIKGHPAASGLNNTRLKPDKVRAFGLRNELGIRPEWVGEGACKGISLNPF